MIVKMTCDEWNIDIAAFANGLAVVHSLKYGEQPRVFLYKPREERKDNAREYGS